MKKTRRKLYNRCMGACCEDIGLRASPEKIKEAYYYWLKRNEISGARLSMSPYNESLGLDPTYYTDIHLIYPMLVFVKADYYHPEYPNKRNDSIVYHYTCRHFNKKLRLCNIYEFRPTMCRTYPDNKFCNNPKCRWKKQIKLREQAEKEIKRLEKEKLKIGKLVKVDKSLKNGRFLKRGEER